MKSSRLTTLASLYLRRALRPEAVSEAAVPSVPQQPSMALERWGTVVDVTPASLGDRFALGRLTFRGDDGFERVLLMERGRTRVSFHWLNGQGKWQRRVALVSEIKPGMRAEVWEASGVAEAVLLEGRPLGPSL
jgi:hypothetical protein